MKYSKDTCVTAGELRDVGLNIDENIPDDAWVPRDSVELSEPVVSIVGATSLDGMAYIPVHVSFSKPFKLTKKDALLRKWKKEDAADDKRKE